VSEEGRSDRDELTLAADTRHPNRMVPPLLSETGRDGGPLSCPGAPTWWANGIEIGTGVGIDETRTGTSQTATDTETETVVQAARAPPRWV
jgi:hypothetical protein